MQYSPYQQPQQETQSIIMIAIILPIYEAIILIMWFFLSQPIYDVLSAIISLGNTPQLTLYGGLNLTVLDMLFAIAFMIPIVWVFVWVFRKERRYNVGRIF